jgi:hypothetical protein
MNSPYQRNIDIEYDAIKILKISIEGVKIQVLN